MENWLIFFGFGFGFGFFGLGAIGKSLSLIQPIFQLFFLLFCHATSSQMFMCTCSFSHSPMVGCNSLYGSNFDFCMAYFASRHPRGMVLYNTVLYCMLLYNIVLYGTVQYCIVFIILYCMVLYYIICYCTVLYVMILYSTVLYGALQ